MTYWRRCSTLWKPPSHGRRLRVRPVRSPGTADIWCCDAASSGGRMSLSSWLFGGKKRLSQGHQPALRRSSRRGVDRLHREPGRSFPIDAPWKSTTHAAPGGVHPPTEAPHREFYQAPSRLPDLARPKRPPGSSRRDLGRCSPHFLTCTMMHEHSTEERNLTPLLLRATW